MNGPSTTPRSSRVFSVCIATAALLVMGSVSAAIAEDLTPQKVDALQQSLKTSQAQRATLQKSLKQVEEQAKALAASIEKLKSDAAAQQKIIDDNSKLLRDNAALVRKYEEQKSAALVKTADEAKAKQDQAAAALKIVLDKAKAAQDAISQQKSQKIKADTAAADAEKAIKAQQEAATKAGQAKTAADQEAAAAKKAADDAAAKLAAAAKKAADANKAAVDAADAARKTTELIASSKKISTDSAAKIKAGETSLAALQPDLDKNRAALAAVSADTVQKQIAAEKTLIALGKLESFSEKVAPVLVKRCLACHDAKTAKGRFNVETFAALMRGGESGASVTPNKSGESNLVTLIEDGSMPQDADPLSKEEIASIRKWIDTGAKLDAGLNSTDPLIAVMPSMPQPAAPVAYRVPLPVTAIAFSPDGQLLASSGYHEVILWSPQDGRQLRRITNVAERVYDVQFSPDGKLIAVAAGTPGQLGEIKLFNSADGEFVADLARSGDSVFVVAFSPDGKRLAAGGADRSIRIFDVASGKQERLIEDHADWVMQLAWSPDGTRLISASRDKTSKVFDTKTGDSLATFNGHGEPVFGVAVSPDGKTAITSGRDKSLRKWTIADAKETGKIAGFGDEVLRVVATADGKLFSCSADKKAHQHALADGKAVKQFSGHTDWVYSLSYNPATKRLATGSYDGEIRIWNAEDGKSLVTFVAAPGFKRPVATAAK